MKRKNIITALDDKIYRERLENIEILNIIGRDILYVEGIEEFLEEFSDIQIVLISEKIFTINKKFINELVEKNNKIAFFILYSKTIKNEFDSKENICFYEKEEFLKVQSNLLNIEKKEEFDVETTLELENTILELKNIQEQQLVEKQNSFLETNFGKVINSALDIGIKAILPNLIEDEIISLKNTILENGLKEGMKSVINSSLNLGKSAIGIFTGEFENISQIQTAVKNGGLIDGLSNVLDYSIKFAKNKGFITVSTANMLKQGKNTILNSISSKIEEELTEQLKAAEKLQEHCNKWQENYEKQNFSGMEINIKNIEKYLDRITPLENTINQARKIENLHELVKNNGKIFDISENEKILAEKLAI